MARTSGKWFPYCFLPLLLTLSLWTSAAESPVASHLQKLLLAGRMGELPGVAVEHWAELQHLYRQRDWRLIWSDVEGRAYLDRQRQLVAWITLSHAHGLDPRDYGYERLQSQDGLSALSTEALLNDLLMSHAFIRLARDLSGSGLELRAIDPLWRLPPKTIDVTALLQRLEQGASVDQLLRGLLPRAAEYDRLLALHAELLAQAGPASEPVAELPVGLLRSGDRDPGVVLLRDWLSRRELLNAAASSLEESVLYTERVADAVRALQRQRGLEADGIYGPATRAAMLFGPARQLQQVRINLARWRALPAFLGRRYLLVRTAAFNLDLVENGELVERHAVISGRPERPSLSFAADVNRLVLNPPWTVPFRLAVEDLLPKQQRDPGYFERLGIEVLALRQGDWQPVDPASIAWSELSRRNFPYLLRQRPGPHNSLGRIRFGMANPHSIFLHDTPQQSLFLAASRAFSSGCIRVRDIRLLAGRLLADDTLETELQQGDTRQLPLPRSLPVYLVYLTVWVDESGEAYFHPDLYGGDARLGRVLGPPPAPISPQLTQLAHNLLKK